MKVRITAVRESDPPLYELEPVCETEPVTLEPGTVLEVADQANPEGDDPA